MTALKAGHWVLLDEINLASAETLECLSGLLESASGSVVLADRGSVTAHTLLYVDMLNALFLCLMALNSFLCADVLLICSLITFVFYSQ